MPLNWDMVVKRYTEQPYVTTKTGETQRVAEVTETALIMDLPGGRQSVSRKKLESAVALIEGGRKIRTVSDYRQMVADERPAYAWAVLRDFGYIV
ncbi:MAG: hypothetical protein WC096_08085 [Sphaerochaetaceae bacterium]|uniref:hypothetical protein n=1 Tax=Methanoculleus sp. TaxID=90427 RepID=UPI00262CE334|nr:hypothetical protein [Methanoculleus sp.]MDD4315117.1 hypothetical protein [Methanoculleus sp.]